ncbi:uncharacterized protein LOC143235387 isoform X2 [Tachypleus tridentatus]|uniref:uncharacterized protein LOC143235387 isoform X2 n=1 Tax=Tachypleus tridentatus TaxID=6853 RepID=UPI003FD3431C
MMFSKTLGLTFCSWHCILCYRYISVEEQDEMASDRQHIRLLVKSSDRQRQEEIVQLEQASTSSRKKSPVQGSIMSRSPSLNVSGCFGGEKSCSQKCLKCSKDVESWDKHLLGTGKPVGSCLYNPKSSVSVSENPILENLCSYVCSNDIQSKKEESTTREVNSCAETGIMSSEHFDEDEDLDEDGEYAESCNESYNTDGSVNFNSCMYDAVQLCGSPVHTSPNLVVAQALLSVRLDDGDYATPIDAIPFCSDLPGFRTDEDTDLEDSISLLGATAKSETGESIRRSPSLRPSRRMRPLRFKIDETCSEANYDTTTTECSDTGYEISRMAHSEGNYNILGSSSSQRQFKSLRSRSEPSAQYTTVLKPKAVRPPIVNINRDEYRSSIDSFPEGSVAFRQHQSRRSAFQEHTTNTQENNIFLGDTIPPPPPPRCSFSLKPNDSIASTSSFSTRVAQTRHKRTDSNSLRPENNRGKSRKSSERKCNLIDKTHKCQIPVSSSSTSNKIMSSNNIATLVSGEKGATAENCFTDVRAKNHSIEWDIIWARNYKKECMYCQHGAKCNHEHSLRIQQTLKEVGSSLLTFDPSSGDRTVIEPEVPCRTESLQSDNEVDKCSVIAYFRRRKVQKNSKNNTPTKSKKPFSEKSCQRSISASIKAAFLRLFGLPKNSDNVNISSKQNDGDRKSSAEFYSIGKNNVSSPFKHRALPPTPDENLVRISSSHQIRGEFFPGCFSEEFGDEPSNSKMDYASSIQKVKDCGWYWGPISGEMAERLLANEPDGSFVVRDSSDEHYIFSLTFKLNGLVRHVRIEQDHGNFSFGCLQRFTSNTIVDFIENAVEHSRSGRYLFFLHRRPVLGPMRVQLLHPVSRFKQVQSLQHLCLLF